MILVVAEHRGGKLNRASWEAVAAAQQLAAGQPVAIAVLGANIASIATELAAAQVQEVITLDSPALEPYTPDGFTAALQQAIDQLAVGRPVTAHLPDARLRTKAGRPPRQSPYHRRDRIQDRAQSREP
jgi:electron transfer flavoprotein alpha subunit